MASNYVFFLTVFVSDGVPDAENACRDSIAANVQKPGYILLSHILDFSLSTNSEPTPVFTVFEMPFGVDPLSSLSLKHQDLRTHTALRVATKRSR